jgi:hypothetical protein
MIYLFTGPAPFAQMVREELLKRGVGADLSNEEPFSQLGEPSTRSAGWQSVVVPKEVAERHRAVIDEVLALVSEAGEGTVAEPGPETDRPNA